MTRGHSSRGVLNDLQFSIVDPDACASSSSQCDSIPSLHRSSPLSHTLIRSSSQQSSWNEIASFVVWNCFHIKQNMLRVLSNNQQPSRMDTTTTPPNSRSSSRVGDEEDDEGDHLPPPPSGRNLKVKVPLRRSDSSQQQRLRAKAMGITTISEDEPLETGLTDTEGSTSKRKNGVRRSRSMGDSKNGSGSSTSEGGRPSKRSEQPQQRRSQSEGRKGIHWNHRVEKKRHHRLQDLTKEEKEAVWYTESDSKIILAMAKVTVKMMMKGEQCDDVDYCSRGLEGKTPAGSKQRQKNKLKVRRALLEEQQLQREEGSHDPEYLAQVSIKHSKDICEQARNTALRDEEAIREYLSSGVISQRDCSPVQPRRTKR
jgi:hypothetical protein